MNMFKKFFRPSKIDWENDPLYPVEFLVVGGCLALVAIIACVIIIEC